MLLQHIHIGSPYRGLPVPWNPAACSLQSNFTIDLTGYHYRPGMSSPFSSINWFIAARNWFTGWEKRLRISSRSSIGSAEPSSAGKILVKWNATRANATIEDIKWLRLPVYSIMPISRADAFTAPLTIMLIERRRAMITACVDLIRASEHLDGEKKKMSLPLNISSIGALYGLFA